MSTQPYSFKPAATLEEQEARYLNDGAYGAYGRTQVENLRAIRARFSTDAMRVCRAWYGKTFGWPGYGDTAWVAGELNRAEIAVQTLSGGVG